MKLERKWLTIITINILLLENFAARLKQANLESKSEIANFVNKTDFNNKLKDVTSNKNQINELSRKVKAISTKDLRNKFSIYNWARSFSSKFFQNYLVFIPAIKHIKYVYGTTQIYL